ncbi:MAG: DUF2093 domain-containing protein [Sphingopyxis sp.]|nr:DUF2093 domain-containing protein [Sphingopyxis sp.]
MLVASTQRPARLHYQANGFRVLTPGDHVTCAITGQAIGLDELRYWSVDRQEAYATAAIATDAMMAARAHR